MIKLTRGALTMLLAQYRGILKNAWIKNFAVVAVLATTVTAANADPVEVETWQDAVAPGAPALDGVNGVLNIQESAEWYEDASTITITGGEDHKIGGEEDYVSIFAEEESVENEEYHPTGNIVIDTTGKGASDAKLTIGAKNKGTTTGVYLDSVLVKAGSNDSDATANLTVNNILYIAVKSMT